MCNVKDSEQKTKYNATFALGVCLILFWIFLSWSAPVVERKDRSHQLEPSQHAVVVPHKGK